MAADERAALLEPQIPALRRYAYGLLRDFDLPEVASSVRPRPVLLLDPASPLGEPAGAAARELYSGLPHARVQTTGDQDSVEILAAWIRGQRS